MDFNCIYLYQLSGDTFGLPLSEAAVRNFMITYGSGPWMFPLPDNETHSTRNDFGWAYNYPLTIDYQLVSSDVKIYIFF